MVDLASFCLCLKGVLNQIGRVFILLEEAGLKPNLGSYSAALECMGRSLNCSPKTVTRYVNFSVNISKIRH